jgi:hypothetical protein
MCVCVCVHVCVCVSVCVCVCCLSQHLDAAPNLPHALHGSTYVENGSIHLRAHGMLVLHGSCCMDRVAWIVLHGSCCMDRVAWIVLHGSCRMDRVAWIVLHGSIHLQAHSMLVLHGRIAVTNSCLSFLRTSHLQAFKPHQTVKEDPNVATLRASPLITPDCSCYCSSQILQCFKCIFEGERMIFLNPLVNLFVCTPLLHTHTHTPAVVC